MRYLPTLMILALFSTPVLSAQNKKGTDKSKKDCDIGLGPLGSNGSDVIKLADKLPPASPGCANPKPLIGICNSIYQKREEPKESPFAYYYERQIYEASCAKHGEPEEVIKKKIQNMWLKLDNPHLKCNQANFGVDHGNVLKYALKMDEFFFLGLAVEVWEVNLNSIDNDNETLLDYLKSEMERTKSSEDYRVRYQDLYKDLRKRGARHRRGL
jgi:hypothetical protein